MNRFLCGSIAGILLFWGGCESSSEYYRMEARELASGVRHDSTLLGIRFGMSPKAFFAHCWELNKTGIILQGPMNQTVEFPLGDRLPFPARMNFYPKFHEGKIYELPVTAAYNGWAPWNRHLYADSLQAQLLRLFESWYGPGFLEVRHPQKPPAFVKVDGNRRITLYAQDDQFVKIIFLDLLADKALNP